ncbi:hypothetical protein BJX70DRAFT_398022 [Aspergillus crustosus]
MSLTQNERAIERACAKVVELWGDRGREFLSINSAHHWQLAAASLARTVPDYLEAMPFVVRAIAFRLEAGHRGRPLPPCPGCADLKRAREIASERPRAPPVYEIVLVGLGLRLSRQGLLEPLLSGPPVQLSSEEERAWRKQEHRVEPPSEEEGKYGEAKDERAQIKERGIEVEEAGFKAAEYEEAEDKQAEDREAEKEGTKNKNPDTKGSEGEESEDDESEKPKQKKRKLDTGSSEDQPAAETVMREPEPVLTSTASIHKYTDNPDQLLKIILEFCGEDTEIPVDPAHTSKLSLTRIFGWLGVYIPGSPRTLLDLAALEWDKYAADNNAHPDSMRYGFVQQLVECDPIFWLISAIQKGSVQLFAFPQPLIIGEHSGGVIMSKTALESRVCLLNTQCTFQPSLLTMNELKIVAGRAFVSTDHAIEVIAEARKVKVVPTGPDDEGFLTVTSWGGHCQFNGVSPLSDAILGYRKYSDPAVQAEIQILLGADRVRAYEFILEWRRIARAQACLWMRLWETTQQQRGGANSVGGEKGLSFFLE